MIKLPSYYHIHMDYNLGQNKGLHIDLSPEWKELVANGYIKQEHVDKFRESVGKIYLRDTGFNSNFDYMKYRISWGEWGPEHIEVPGNATGLDICTACGMTFEGGRRLAPHNIDTSSQMIILLQTFLWFADALILDKIVNHNGDR